MPAALALRDLLAEVGLTGFAKTSGNRGIHVFAPIEPEHEFLDVRHAVIALSRELERRMPGEVTTLAEMRPCSGKGGVFCASGTMKC